MDPFSYAIPGVYFWPVAGLVLDSWRWSEVTPGGRMNLSRLSGLPVAAALSLLPLPVAVKSVPTVSRSG